MYAMDIDTKPIVLCEITLQKAADVTLRFGWCLTIKDNSGFSFATITYLFAC